MTAEAAPPRRCPVCGKPATADHIPFCSARCADVDLHRWLNGAYAIPAAPVPDDEATRPATTNGAREQE